MPEHEAEAEAFFRAIPWCATLIDDPNFDVKPTGFRTVKPHGVDSLPSQTLNSPRTIRAVLTLAAKPIPAAGLLPARIEEARFLMDLGDGMNGHAGVLHGGMIATLLDEAMGGLLVLNADVNPVAAKLGAATRTLQVEYHRPIRVPGVVVVVARTREQKGRRVYTEGWFQDENGKVLAKGEAMWIAIGGKL